MFKRILIPLDGSVLAESVLPHAIALSSTNHPDIFLLRVIDPIAAETRPRSVDPLDWNFRIVEAEAYLKKITELLSGMDLVVYTEVREGKAAETILEYAHEQQVDLVVLSSHGKSGITGWNISSVVQKIIQRINTSFLLVRAYQARETEEHRGSYRKILLPLDGSQRAESILGIAVQLARAQDAELCAAHIVRRPEMPRQKPLSQEDSQLADRVIERNTLEAEAYLNDLKSRIDMPLETFMAVGQNVASELQRLVEEVKADLVILTAHGSSGESGWPYGSLVVTMITYGSTPLLIYQDLVPENILPTKAEEIAKDLGGR
jgi:nucleotide-binding universal stress UspA family protein